MKCFMCVLALSFLLTGCKETPGNNNSELMTITLDHEQTLHSEPTIPATNLGDGSPSFMDTMYSGEVYEMTQFVAEDKRQLLQDQINSALNREELNWKYISSDQFVIDQQWRSRIEALDLDPSSLFNVSLTRLEELPKDYFRETITIVYEGQLSAEEGYRILEDISDDDKQNTHGYCISVMEVVLNDFPVLFINLWLSTTA